MEYPQAQDGTKSQVLFKTCRHNAMQIVAIIMDLSLICLKARNPAPIVASPPALAPACSFHSTNSRNDCTASNVALPVKSRTSLRLLGTASALDTVSIHPSPAPPLLLLLETELPVPLAFRLVLDRTPCEVLTSVSTEVLQSAMKSSCSLAP